MCADQALALLDEGAGRPHRLIQRRKKAARMGGLLHERRLPCKNQATYIRRRGRMGFREDMAAFDAARAQASEEAKRALSSNSANAARVVAEIEAILADALEYVTKRIPRGSGYLVVQQSKVRFWWASSPWWMLTEKGGLVYNRGGDQHVLGHNSWNRERDEAARRAGVPEGSTFTVQPLIPDLRPEASRLMVATHHGWTEGTAMGIPHWETHDRKPYADLLDGRGWYGQGFGITPTGKPAIVSVREQQPGADGSPFRIDMYEFGTWLGYGIQEEVLAQGRG